MFNNSNKNFAEFCQIMELSTPEMTWYGIWKYLSDWNDNLERERAVVIAQNYFKRHGQTLKLSAFDDEEQCCKSLLFFSEEIISDDELKFWLPDILAAFLFHESGSFINTCFYKDSINLDETEISELRRINELHRKLEAVLQKCTSPKLFEKAKEEYQNRYDAHIMEYDLGDDRHEVESEVVHSLINSSELDSDAFALASLSWKTGEPPSTEILADFCLSHTNLTPHQVFRCMLDIDPRTGLTSLDLRSPWEEGGYLFDLKCLPKEIGNLVELEQLSLYEMYELKELPIEFAQLTNLEILEINCCGFEKIPEPVFELANLKELIIKNSGCYESLISISPKIEQLEKLEKLEILGNKKLNYLPKEIGQLQQLKELIIKENELKFIPESIRDKLDKLRTTKIKGD